MAFIETEAHLQTLYRIDKFLSSISDLDSLLLAIIKEGAAVTGAESASIGLCDELKNELYFYVAGGSTGRQGFEQKLECVRLKMGEGVIGWCAENREPVNVKNTSSDSRFSAKADSETGFRTESLLAVPMIVHNKLIGVIEAVNKTVPGGFTESDQKVLAVLASQAALVIENATLYQENLRHARLSALGQGIAGAAHCIKNILNGIDGGSYILERALEKNNFEKVMKGWDILSRNTKIMKTLVMDMLAYSKDRKPEYVEYEINRVCIDIRDLLQDDAAERGISIVLELSEDIGNVTIDPQGIYRCLLNFVSNSIDACGNDGIVKLKTDIFPQDNLLTVSVSDNGCGISKENIEKLFQVFFSTKGSKGTGLGLSVSHKIITEHGGEIKVTSEPGCGTEFSIHLPLNRTGT